MHENVLSLCRQVLEWLPRDVEGAGLNRYLLSFQREHMAQEHWTRSHVPHGGGTKPSGGGSSRGQQQREGFPGQQRRSRVCPQ